MNVADKILAARTALLWDQPFFGTLAVQLHTVDATDDPEINTMATDGKHLYFHGPFVEKLTKHELIFVLAHEVMHNALEHHIRRGSRDPKLWNIACDFAINGELVETKVGKMPEAGLIDARFTGLGAEEIYRILQQEMQKNGSATAGGVTFVPGQANPGGFGEVKDGCPQHDEAAIAEARAENQTRIRQAAAIAKAANAGSIPAGLKRIIEELLMPKVDWRAVLRRFVDESITRDFTWLKPNRRLLPHGLITPGMIGDGIPHLVIGVDSSGSTFDKEVLTAFASEINGIFGDGTVDRISVIYCDTKVQSIDEFELGDELRIEPIGGGGTAFSDFFRVVRRDFGEAKACIFLTDMHVYDFGEDPDMPVLWGVYGRTKDFGTLAPPFGECINISV